MLATMIAVFLVDDHEIVRRGLADLIATRHDMEVVGEAGTVRSAIERIRACRPDVAVLDLRLPDGSGIDLCRQVRSELGTACLILTAFDDDDAVLAAVLAGAAGYLLKSTTGSGLLESIIAVGQGKVLLSPEAARRTSARLGDPADDPRWTSLGLRERQVLACIADGLTNRQIGERLGLAEKTIKNYVSSLLLKLGLSSRTQAALFRRDHGE
ncbi:LuxR family transcriptional regulator [Leifsonia xyli subsp. xyli]|uniref:LuxR family transcriptional regulator n=1 Tax=Leifsonia xyli subsp. xyli TaxID=59736 RepID=A0A1E2SJK3_LEIXY|nr:LuxR family transcriptional regulator [Leifsonia xyli subsp. xyli]